MPDKTPTSPDLAVLEPAYFFHPLRYALIEKKTDSFYGYPERDTLLERVPSTSHVVPEGYIYTPSLLNAGYLYIWFETEKQSKGTTITHLFKEFLCSQGGGLKNIVSDLSEDEREPQPDESKSPYYPLGKNDVLWVAFSLVQWPASFIDQIRSCNKTRENYMQRFSVQEWINDKEAQQDALNVQSVNVSLRTNQPYQKPTQDWNFYRVKDPNTTNMEESAEVLHYSGRFNTIRTQFEAWKNSYEAAKSREADSSDNKNIFFCLADTWSSANDLCDDIAQLELRHRATIYAVKTGMSVDSIYNQLLENPQLPPNQETSATDSMTPKDFEHQYDLAIFTNSTLFGSIDYLEEEINRQDSHSNSIEEGLKQLKKKARMVNREAIERILCLSERKRLREALFKKREQLLSLLDHDAYETHYTFASFCSKKNLVACREYLLFHDSNLQKNAETLDLDILATSNESSQALHFEPYFEKKLKPETDFSKIFTKKAYVKDFEIESDAEELLLSTIENYIGHFKLVVDSTQEIVNTRTGKHLQDFLNGIDFDDIMINLEEGYFNDIVNYGYELQIDTTQRSRLRTRRTLFSDELQNTYKRGGKKPYFRVHAKSARNLTASKLLTENNFHRLGNGLAMFNFFMAIRNTDHTTESQLLLTAASFQLLRCATAFLKKKQRSTIVINRNVVGRWVLRVNPFGRISDLLIIMSHLLKARNAYRINNYTATRLNLLQTGLLAGFMFTSSRIGLSYLFKSTGLLLLVGWKGALVIIAILFLIALVDFLIKRNTHTLKETFFNNFLFHNRREMNESRIYGFFKTFNYYLDILGRDKRSSKDQGFIFFVATYSLFKKKSRVNYLLSKTSNDQPTEFMRLLHNQRSEIISEHFAHWLEYENMMEELKELYPFVMVIPEIRETKTVKESVSHPTPQYGNIRSDFTTKTVTRMRIYCKFQNIHPYMDMDFGLLCHDESDNTLVSIVFKDAAARELNIDKNFEDLTVSIEYHISSIDTDLIRHNTYFYVRALLDPYENTYWPEELDNTPRYYVVKLRLHSLPSENSNMLVQDTYVNRAYTLDQFKQHLNISQTKTLSIH